MQTNEKLYALAALLLTASITAQEVDDTLAHQSTSGVASNNSCQEDDCLDGWDMGVRSMRDMHHRMMTVLDEMDQMMAAAPKMTQPKKSGITMDITEDETHVHVNAKNLKIKKEQAQNIDVRRKAGIIKVTFQTDDGYNVDMDLSPRTLTMGTRYEEKRQEKKDDTVTNSFHSSSMSYITRPLPCKVILADVTVSFDDATGTLTISVPKCEDEIEHRINVNIR